MRDVTQNVVLPELKQLEKYLCDITERECATPQVGRTHGQHAVPITFGWSIAEFVSRLGKSILRIEVLKTHEKEFADITAQLEKLGIENPAAFFENPANYCGLAAIKSKRLAQKYRDLM